MLPAYKGTYFQKHENPSKSSLNPVGKTQDRSLSYICMKQY